MSPPSFPSFPPSFGSFPEQEPSSSKTPAVHDSQGEKKIKHHDKQQKPKKSKRVKHEDPFLDDEHTKAKEDNARDKQSDYTLFFTDRRGDPLNVRYGGLHIHDVPKHKLVGRGRQVLGLTSEWRVLRREGKGVEIGTDDRQTGRKTLTDSSTRRLLAAPTRSILPGHSTYRHEEVDGYLRLPSRHQKSDPQSTYRSIISHKDILDSNSSSDDSGEFSEESSDEEPLEETRQSTLRRLEDTVRTNPTSVMGWLSLLSHTLSTTPILSKNALIARAEITVSVLRRALDAHPTNKSSYPLLFRYLSAGEEIWHESELRSEWTRAIAARPSTDLWLEWLEWRLRANLQGVEGIVEDGTHCLGGVQDEQGKLRVFWRLATAFEAAGYVERATAMFQAQAELTFGCPQSLRKEDHPVQMKGLEEFWDSEAPRFGEKGARGWCNWLSQHDGVAADLQPSVLSLAQTGDQYRLWAEQELVYDKALRLSIRSNQDDAELDPYSTVLFMDVQPFLFHITSKEAKNNFRLAWISFLGLPIPGLNRKDEAEDMDDRWRSGYLTGQGYQETLLPRRSAQAILPTESHAGIIVGKEKQHPSVFGPVKSWGGGVVEPLDSCLLEQTPRLWYWGKEDVVGTDEQLVRNVFHQLRLGDEDYEWDQLSFAYEALQNLKSALKSSRQLLSRLQNSTKHWSYHAKLERLRGVEGARKIYENVLGPSSNCLDDPYAPILWWDWAELEWLVGLTEKALNIILRSVNEKGTGHLTVLRAKRTLDDKIIDAGLSWKAREAWIKLKALVILLTSSTENALSVFDMCPQLGEVAQESLTVASLTFLYCHTRLLKNPSPPATLRQRATNAYKNYPQNSIILGVFLESEKGQAIWGRTRILFNESDERPAKGVVRRIQELWLADWERGGLDVHAERTRNALERAVLDPRTRLSSTIWNLYILFEVRCGELQKAKNLIYRAIKTGPLNKSLYLLAFTAVREAFKPSELMSFADSMAERGIRTRKGLDEMEVEVDSDVDMSDEDGEDEIEREAAETRRLRPYK